MVPTMCGQTTLIQESSTLCSAYTALRDVWIGHASDLLLRRRNDESERLSSTLVVRG